MSYEVREESCCGMFCVTEVVAVTSSMMRGRKGVEGECHLLLERLTTSVFA